MQKPCSQDLRVRLIEAIESLPSSIARKMPVDHGFPLYDCRSTSEGGTKRLSDDFLPAGSPKGHPPFDDDEGLVHNDAHQRDYGEACKHERNVEAAACHHHQVANAAVSGDRL